MQFAKRLREAVERGDVTASVRIWTRPRVKPGGRYAMGRGWVEVDSIDQIELADVTPALARETGFNSVVDLLKVAKHGSGTNVYLVRFHYVPSDSRASRRRSRAPAARQRRRIVDIIESLAEGAAIEHGTHLSLEVRGRRFGWFLDDHHGDGRVAVNCKASAEVGDVLRQLAPELLHAPSYLGNRGWIGLWLDKGQLDWSVVELALREAYRLVAPKALIEDP